MAIIELVKEQTVTSEADRARRVRLRRRSPSETVVGPSRPRSTEAEVENADAVVEAIEDRAAAVRREADEAKRGLTLNASEPSRIETRRPLRGRRVRSLSPRHHLRRHRLLRLGPPARAADGVRGARGRRCPRCCASRSTLTVAGRTDAGVHAERSGRAPGLSAAAAPAEPERLVRRLARFLPPDVRIKAVTEVPAEFDARFSAIRRHYEYRISTARYGAEPLRARDTVSVPQDARPRRDA